MGGIWKGRNGTKGRKLCSMLLTKEDERCHDKDFFIVIKFYKKNSFWLKQIIVLEFCVREFKSSPKLGFNTCTFMLISYLNFYEIPLDITPMIELKIGRFFFFFYEATMRLNQWEGMGKNMKHYLLLLPTNRCISLQTYHNAK